MPMVGPLWLRCVGSYRCRQVVLYQCLCVLTAGVLEFLRGSWYGMVSYGRFLRTPSTSTGGEERGV